MADEKSKRKIVLEREYVVPLRREWLKKQKYKRATKAVKALKEFMVQHMKVYDRDLRKVKIDIYLNNEIRFRGMKKPLAKVHVKATKYDDGIVEVKLITLPKHIEFEIARNAKRLAEQAKNAKESEKAEVPTPEAGKGEEKTTEKETDIKEKTESSKIATQEMEKGLAKEIKHTNLPTAPNKREPELKRKALKR